MKLDFGKILVFETQSNGGLRMTKIKHKITEIFMKFFEKSCKLYLFYQN